VDTTPIIKYIIKSMIGKEFWVCLYGGGEINKKETNREIKIIN
jgi:hypothetical protein